MRAFVARRDADPRDLVGRILCHDAGSLRKGHAIRAEDLALLFRGDEEIHLLELEGDDVGQRTAGERIANAIRVPGLLALPIGHRHVLRATEDGLLEVDAEALRRLNEIDGVVVFTPRSGEAVGAGDVVAYAQITRLAIARDRIEEAERRAAERPVLSVRPFIPRDAILWRRATQIVEPVRGRLQRYGCRLKHSLPLPERAPDIREAIETFSDSGATLFLICGSNALDPLDPVFAALEQVGATMRCSGIPVHPGTLLWIATLRDITIVGFPPCGLRGEVSAFDLVLPRLLAGVPLEDLAALGHGGLLSRSRVRPFAEEEAVIDAIR